MTFMAFTFAVMALLLAPGPTNTLMGLAGAERGLRGMAHLLPAELGGYLTTILPVSFIGAGVFSASPAAGAALKVIAAVWVMYLAVRLWGRGDDAGVRGEVTARKVYLTTMLNPKALIFGLVLLPAPADATFAPKLALFCLLVVCIALVWGASGTLVRRGVGGAARLQLLQRIASVWLLVVSVTLIAGVIGA